MILITGANGFIGSVLTRYFNQQGESDIICVDTISPIKRPEPLGKAEYSEFIGYDQLPAFLDSSSAKDLEGIFHMGAISSTTEKNWEKLVEHNITLPQSLFQFCTRQEIPYIYASSGAVYGDGSRGFDDEKHPSEYEPLNLYGKSKRDFDIWAMEQAKIPPHWYGLRFYNVYGPNEYHKGEMASLIFKSYNQIRETGKMKLFRSNHADYKDGEQMRDFVYVKDIARWMVEIFKNPRFHSGIYNQGSGQARTWLDLAKQTFASMNLKTNIEWMDIPENIRNQYQNFTEAKMTKAFKNGLSKPEYTLEKGIHDYISGHLMNPKDKYY